MDKKQEDTLNMYQASDEVLLNNSTVYSGNIPFQGAADMLGDKIEAIENLRDQQDEDISGVTQDKENRRETLEALTYQAGSIIVFYASVTNNRKLLQKVNFTQTDLSRARDNELPGMSGQVHEEAVSNAVALLPYGLTASMITSLDDALKDYVKYISKPRAAKTETSAATEQLPKIFEDTDTLLEEQLDKGMELYRVSDPDFYQQYFNARVIINSPTLKRALQLNFVDSITGKPIARVNVAIDGSIKRRTTDLGNAFVQNLTEGAHSFTANLPGYQDVSQNFNVISGETTRITVSMVKV